MRVEKEPTVLERELAPVPGVSSHSDRGSKRGRRDLLAGSRARFFSRCSSMKEPGLDSEATVYPGCAGASSGPMLFSVAVAFVSECMQHRSMGNFFFC